jgi:hypothetical protein
MPRRSNGYADAPMTSTEAIRNNWPWMLYIDRYFAVSSQGATECRIHAQSMMRPRAGVNAVLTDL